MGQRLNARIDDALVEKLQMLRKHTRLNDTTLIKKALERYYEYVMRGNQKRPLDILTQTGFVGCAEGSKDLSTRYKTYLATSLKKKL